MVKIRTLIWSIFIFLFIVFSLTLFVVLILNYSHFSNLHKSQWIENILDNVDTLLTSYNERVCEPLFTIRKVLANKSINTTDRISLNLFFIPILESNPWIHSIEVILPNGFEYVIEEKSNTWETISQISTGKSVLRKKALWAQDGLQLLEETVEEREMELLLRNRDWYKGAVSVCVKQKKLNRDGPPKLWIEESIEVEGKPYKLSRVTLAVGYDDAPYSVVSLLMDWSWLHDVTKRIFTTWDIRSYIFQEKNLLMKVDTKNIKDLDSDINLDDKNLPNIIIELLNNESTKSKLLVLEKNGYLYVKKPFTLLINYPITAILQIPIKTNYHFSFLLNQFLFSIALMLILIFILAFFLIYLFQKPLILISHWLENPQSETPKLVQNKLWIFEYTVLVNKLQSLFNFFIDWTSNFMSNGKTSQNNTDSKDLIKQLETTQEQSKELFVFSDTGVGGITLETMKKITRENIRLQKHIEALNQYYLQQIEYYSSNKTKIQTVLISFREIITTTNSISIDVNIKIKNILEIVHKTLNASCSCIFKLDYENKKIFSIFSTDNSKNIVLKFEDCKYLIENFQWAEVINIRSSKTDYRTQLLHNQLNAESIIFLPILQSGKQSVLYFIAVLSDTEKNWDWIDESFLVITTKILSNLINKS